MSLEARKRLSVRGASERIDGGRLPEYARDSVPELRQQVFLIEPFKWGRMLAVYAARAGAVSVLGLRRRRRDALLRLVPGAYRASGGGIGPRQTWLVGRQALARPHVYRRSGRYRGRGEVARRARLERRVQEPGPHLGIYYPRDTAEQLNHPGEPEPEAQDIDVVVPGEKIVGERRGDQKRRADGRALNAFANLFPGALIFSVADRIGDHDAAGHRLGYHAQVHAARFAEFRAFYRLDRAARAKHSLSTPLPYLGEIARTRGDAERLSNPCAGSQRKRGHAGEYSMKG